MAKRDDHESSAFTSKGREVSDWKSPRKIAEEKRLYIRKRFEFYMELEDMEMLTRELGIAALRAEIAEASDD